LAKRAVRHYGDWMIGIKQRRPQLTSRRSPLLVRLAVVGGIVGAHGTVRAEPLPFGDYRGDRPGTRHHITTADLPEPNAAESVDKGAQVIPQPKGAWPQAPQGFTIQRYAENLANPRLVRVAPNGDAFIAESSSGIVRILRGVTEGGRAETNQIFARGLRQPFGIAFYPPVGEPAWIYVANTDAVVRIPYRNGDVTARAAPATVVTLPGGGLLRGGGHWTRDIAFSRDGKKMFVSVGSHSNNDDTDGNPTEFHRADILEFTPEGGPARVFAWGIRNAVGIAVSPSTGALWASVNERDRLGDNLVPDYITQVTAGGFYGWPWFYIGAHADPRHRLKHPELKEKVIVPDVLLQAHSASLEMVFYDGKSFPAEYQGDIFAAEHGSWNKTVRTGYKVIRVPLHGTGHASGQYEDFVTGFVTAQGEVWGRPVGVAAAKDGALLVTDDGSNSVWRVSYAPKKPATPASR
jgi:glucose/arabinose dehydrogenase